MEIPETRFARALGGAYIAYQVTGVGPDLVFLPAEWSSSELSWESPLDSAFLSALAMTYGTPELIRSFGLGRAEDFSDPWYVEKGLRHGLADRHELDAMVRAWTVWAEAPNAYAAFAWCHALGWKPG